MQKTVTTDLELLRQIAASNEFALRMLYEKYWSKLYDYALSKLESQDIAEDVVQDIFIDLWNRRENLMIERLESYLFRTARNKIIDVIRASLIRKHHEESSLYNYIPASKNLDVEEEIAYKELHNAIHEGLALLPEKTREIFRLNRLDQLSSREVSVLLDIPVRTVEYHITHALRTLKLYLRDFVTLTILLTV